MGSIEEPLSIEDLGQFNCINYRRYSGRFVGESSQGDYIVPYEITAPANPTEGILRVLVEPPDFNGGLIVREGYLGPRFIFGRGYSHAAVGYSPFGLHILNPNPGFQIVIGGQLYNPPPAPPPPVGIDLEIIADFATALRISPPLYLGAVRKIYSVGASDSGNAIHKLLEKPYGQYLFDFSLPGTTRVRDNHHPADGNGLVFFFQSEFEFNPNK